MVRGPCSDVPFPSPPYFGIKERPHPPLLPPRTHPPPREDSRDQQVEKVRETVVMDTAIANVSIVKPQARYPTSQGHLEDTKGTKSAKSPPGYGPDKWRERDPSSTPAASSYQAYWRLLGANTTASHPLQLAVQALCPPPPPMPPPALFPLRGAPPGGGKKKVFQCPHCRYMTDRKNNLKRHIGTMHSDCGKTLECCDLRFRSKASLRDHIYLFHRAGYRCKFCARNFVRKALLKRHLAVHLGQTEALELLAGWPGLRTGSGKVEPTRKPADSHMRTQDPDNLPSAGRVQGCRDKPTTPEEIPMEIKVSPPRPSFRCWGSFLTQRLLHTHAPPPPPPPPPYRGLLLKMATTDPARDEAAAAGGGRLLSTSPRRLCPAPYKCSSCSAVFSNQSALEEHGCRGCGAQGRRQAPSLPLRRLARGGRGLLVHGGIQGLQERTLTDPGRLNTGTCI